MQYNRVRAKEWLENYYHGEDRPTLTTVLNRLKAGVLPGSNASGEWVVYCDVHYEPIKLDPDPSKPERKSSKPPTTGNRFVDNIIAQHT
ncbi:hypothetical protein [Thiolinea disciformis]|uniref:hypothetical protein n=1 Tax=Thiolinea disciformis TaxID=125614 RepID=UPI0003747D1B|nr:hypothetical protein [Thiolinea disciformis]